MVEFNWPGRPLPDDPELAHLPGKPVDTSVHPDPELAHLPGRTLTTEEVDLREREIPSHVADRIFREGGGRYPDDF